MNIYLLSCPKLTRENTHTHTDTDTHTHTHRHTHTHTHTHDFLTGKQANHRQNCRTGGYKGQKHREKAGLPDPSQQPPKDDFSGFLNEFCHCETLQSFLHT